MNMKKTAVFILLISIIPIVFSACNRKPGKTEVNKIRLAYIPYTADLPFFVAMEKGMFKKKGVDVEAIECANSSDALDLVLSGKADGAMGNSFSSLFSIHSKDANLLQLINVSVETFEQDRYTGFILVKSDSNISTLNDLKGKRVGTEKGASQLIWVQLFVKNMGWIIDKDIIVEQEAPENLLNALNTEQFDAIFTFEPYATVGISKGIAKPLLPFFRSKIIDPFPAGGATFSRMFVKNNSKTARLSIEALDQAIDFINTNPDEAKKTLFKYTPLEKSQAIESKIYFWWGSEEISIEPIQKLADILFDNKLLDSKIDVETMVK